MEKLIKYEQLIDKGKKIKQVNECVKLEKQYMKEIDHLKLYVKDIETLKQNELSNVIKLQNVESIMKTIHKQGQVNEIRSEISYFIQKGVLVFDSFAELFKHSQEFYRKRIKQILLFQPKLWEFLKQHNQNHESMMKKYLSQLKKFTEMLDQKSKKEYDDQKQVNLITLTNNHITFLKSSLESIKELKKQAMYLCYGYYLFAKQMWKFKLGDLRETVTKYEVNDEEFQKLTLRTGGNLDGVELKWNKKQSQKQEEQEKQTKQQKQQKKEELVEQIDFNQIIQERAVDRKKK